MKTFLWTTLFWILVAIAGLLCLGFGNLGTQVLDNGWIGKFLPHNLQSQMCDPIVASAVEGIDWCAAAENHGCYVTETEDEDTNDEDTNDESVNMQELIDSLSVLSSNQETIYNQINNYYSSIMQNLSSLAEMCSSSVVEPAEAVIDEREQQRLQLQAQIEALQYQMENL